MADLIISRAGSTSLFEILALKKPNLLIPLSKEARRGDQLENVKSFKMQGFSEILSEGDLTQESLIKKISELDKTKEAFIDKMNATNWKNGVEEVIRVTLENTN